MGRDFLVTIRVQLVIMILEYRPKFVNNHFLKAWKLGHFTCMLKVCYKYIIEIVWKRMDLNFTKSSIKRVQLHSLN